MAEVPQSEFTEQMLHYQTVTLDRRLQSIDGIIGYLDQSIKMGQEAKDLGPIVLFLAKEIKNIHDGK